VLQQVEDFQAATSRQRLLPARVALFRPALAAGAGAVRLCRAPSRC
jgi:hypothetical protein